MFRGQVGLPIARVIRSIQRGTINIPSGTSATATITSVNTAKTHLVYLGHNVPNTSPADGGMFMYIVLTNATTVTVVNSTAGYAGTVSFEVVEYW